MKSTVASTEPRRDDKAQASTGAASPASGRRRAVAASRAPAGGKAVKTVKVGGAAKTASSKGARTAKTVKTVKSPRTAKAGGAAAKAARLARAGGDRPASGKRTPAAKAGTATAASGAGRTGTGSARKATQPADGWRKKRVEELRDDDVLAMPDSEYMSEAQLAFFRLKLSELRESILAKADKTTARLRKDTVVVPDPADRATIEEEHALELRTRDRERKLLKKIEQSIARIDAGDYGYCDETGEPIGVARLLARPTATLSLEAQQRREHRQKMFGD